MTREPSEVAALRAAWGARIRDLRQHRDIKPMALAAACNIHIGTLYRIEAGGHQIGDETRLALARALGIRVEDLFAYPDTTAAEAVPA
jgi:transcriptional regulator with XRE-family HTH domain